MRSIILNFLKCIIRCQTEIIWNLKRDSLLMAYPYTIFPEENNTLIMNYTCSSSIIILTRNSWIHHLAPTLLLLHLLPFKISRRLSTFTIRFYTINREVFLKLVAFPNKIECSREDPNFNADSNSISMPLRANTYKTTQFCTSRSSNLAWIISHNIVIMVISDSPGKI